MLLATAAAGVALKPTQATLIRIIEYLIEDRPGSRELFCLITTITDHELAPAHDLATVYTNAGKSNCPLTRSKPTKQDT